MTSPYAQCDITRKFKRMSAAWENYARLHELRRAAYLLSKRKTRPRKIFNISMTPKREDQFGDLSTLFASLIHTNLSRHLGRLTDDPQLAARKSLLTPVSWSSLF